jgi:SAM-dependent methyltransferase
VKEERSMDFDELQRNWHLFGLRSPVSAIDSGLPTDDWGDFFASGERVVVGLLSRLEATGISLRGTTALDFGCGAGRLTQALARRFEHVVGVDVAPSMLALAVRFNQYPDKCDYVLNKATDLSCFPDATFDFICSLLVLQHVGSKFARGYVAEFVRVLRPGALAVFQLPGELLPATPLVVRLPGEEGLYRAEIRQLRSAPTGVATSTAIRVQGARPLIVDLVVTNRSSTTWAPEHQIRLGKRWLYAARRLVVEPEDDGTRVLLTGRISPGSEVRVTLQTAVPSIPGDYLLEVDLVQEDVTWFRAKGSPTLTLPVTVTGDVPTAAGSDGAAAGPGGARGERDETVPRMEMHGVRREEVFDVVHEAGGSVLAALEDHSAGPEWESFLYVVERVGQKSLPATDPVPVSRDNR